jgi:putative hydrolase of the HAD superfamily
VSRPFDAVLLDAGNTLVFVDPGRTLEILVRHGAAPDVERFRGVERAARIRLSSVMGAGATGDEDQVWRDYFRALFEGAGVVASDADAARAALRAEHAERHLWSWVDPATPAALERLLAEGYRLAVVSNADGRVEGLLRERGLADYFEFVLDSHVVGFAKPDRRIFDLAVSRLDVSPARCLYVGDLYAVDVLGARGAGLEALLLDPFDHFDLDVERIASVAHLPEHLTSLAVAPDLDAAGGVVRASGDALA